MPRVASIVLSLLAVISIIPPKASEGSDIVEACSLDIRESLRMHEHTTRLNRICRSPYAVVACTDFVGATLQAACVADGETWRIVTKVEAQAVVHLTNVKELPHERLHIRAIREQLPRHLEPHLGMRFPSAGSCERLRKVMTLDSYLRAVMNDLKAESNAALGCGPKQVRAARLRRTVGMR